MKRLLAILMILSIMLCTLGCQTSGNYGSDTNFNSDTNSDSAASSENNINFEIDPDLASEIRKAYMEHVTYTDFDAQFWSEDDVLIDSYGTYSGCTVGYIESPISGYLQAFFSEKVGQYTFQYPTSRMMTAYKDGQIKTMKDAYDLGWLDDDAVKQIYEKHRQEYSGVYDYIESKS